VNVIVEKLASGALEVTAGKVMLTVDRSGDPNVASFHSVDLFLAGLGSCMVGTMLDAAEASGIPVGNVRVELRPIISFQPERVSKIKMNMVVGGDLTETQVAELKMAAESCKVHNSLHDGVVTELNLVAQNFEEIGQANRAN
jgi:uncharacterized OsmC-like protein